MPGVVATCIAAPSHHLLGKPGLDATLVVTTYDLDDAAFAAAEQSWQVWSRQLT
jgi:hypothetical protein